MFWCDPGNFTQLTLYVCTGLKQHSIEMFLCFLFLYNSGFISLCSKLGFFPALIYESPEGTRGLFF